ncbi:hypothetical protein [Streptomyces sp. NBC_00091]|uniref:hypothetical protein n=1 Tax=Streptomyces sp. NBC_00091 TaxID=2975648 RepID=UPI00225B20FC|nr:hypothetical protein [Streptomyces sp. NBC_00091]MCX5377631.1 hypothetical protein [Streptomyces sp. NBC_00091]
MITSEPVGEWFWEPSPLTDALGSGASRALDLLRDVRDALAVIGLVTGEGTGSVVLCDRRAEKLFGVRVHVWGEGAVMLVLSAYADAWLTQDLRERPQPEVAAENAPRLAAGLKRISELTGAEVDPGDPTWHACPTADGFAEGPEYDDSWGNFEVPARWRRLTKLLPGGLGEEDYESSTEEPVRYAGVRRGERLLGYLWASADGAAGYGPRTAAGDAAFEAGVPWLLRLRALRLRGLGALEALTELLGGLDDSTNGSVVGSTVHEAASLDALEELSGRH